MAASILAAVLIPKSVEILMSYFPQLRQYNAGNIHYTASKWLMAGFLGGLLLQAGEAWAFDSCIRPPISPRSLNVHAKSAQGDSKTDDTKAIQAAIDEMSVVGGTVEIPDGVYMVDAVTGLQVRNHVTLKMSANAVLKAIPTDKGNYSIIRVVGAGDVNIIGGILQGDRNEHQGKDGEWGMGLTIRASHEVQVQSVTARDNWGDGFYIADKSHKINFCDVSAIRNRRQGMSIVSADTVVVRNSRFVETSGTPPQAGLDIEPNASESVFDVIIENNKFTNNGGFGFMTWVPRNKGAEGRNVKFINNELSGNKWGVTLDGLVQGYVANNRVNGNGSVGIRLSIGTEDVVVTENFVDDASKLIDKGNGNSMRNNKF